MFLEHPPIPVLLSESNCVSLANAFLQMVSEILNSSHKICDLLELPASDCQRNLTRVWYNCSSMPEVARIPGLSFLKDRRR